MSVVELLLSKGADVNQVARDGTSPLYIAATKGHVSMINLLTQEMGAPLKLLDFILMHNLWKSDFFSTKALSEAKWDLSISDTNTATPIVIEAIKGALDYNRLFFPFCTSYKGWQNAKLFILTGDSETDSLLARNLKALHAFVDTIANSAMIVKEAAAIIADYSLDYRANALYAIKTHHLPAIESPPTETIETLEALGNGAHELHIAKSL